MRRALPLLALVAVLSCEKKAAKVDLPPPPIIKT